MEKIYEALGEQRLKAALQRMRLLADEHRLGQFVQPIEELQANYELMLAGILSIIWLILNALLCCCGC